MLIYQPASQARLDQLEKPLKPVQQTGDVIALTSITQGGIAALSAPVLRRHRQRQPQAIADDVFHQRRDRAAIKQSAARVRNSVHRSNNITDDGHQACVRA